MTNFKFIMLAAAMFTLAACTEKGPEQQDDQKNPVGGLTENLAFTLDVKSLEADAAKIEVVSNGTSADTWYGFLTTDLGTSDESLIDAEVSRLASDANVELKKQKVATIILRDLEPETDYKYIVFGVTDEGKVYGTPASVEFTTIKAETRYTINTAWKVEYTGAGEISGSTYEHTVTVTSNDANKYFISVVTKSDFDQKEIKQICEEEVAYLKDFIAQYNATYNANITLDQMLFSGNGKDAFNLAAGEWYALAIGVGSDGEPSGLYAVSGLITVEEEEVSEAYASWVGNWKFTGSNGVSFDVTFHQYKNNESFLMTGWEGLADIPVLVDWYEDYEMWQIDAQYIGDADFGGGQTGSIYIVGNDGKSFYTGEYPLCMGGEVEGERICIGYSEEDETTGEVVFALDHMHFVADIAGGYYGISQTEVWPSFPIMITPSSATASKKSVGVERMIRVPLKCTRDLSTSALKNDVK